MTNIRLCFPLLSDSKQKKLLAESFGELGISVAETLFTWFGDVDVFYQKEVAVEGMEHWWAARKQNKGIILLSCHYMAALT